MKLLILAIILFSISGCTDEESNPASVTYLDDVRTIGIYFSQDSIAGFPGENKRINITAIPFGENLQKITDAEVSLEIVNPEPWKGEILQTVFRSDWHGKVFASFEVELTQFGEVVVAAKHNNIVVVKSLYLVQRPEQAEILSLQAIPDSITLKSGQDYTNIIATLLDTQHNPIRGAQVNFTVESTHAYGYLNAYSGVTNDYGRVNLIYKSYILVHQRRGEVLISAMMGNLKTTIPIIILPDKPDYRIEVSPLDSWVYVKRGNNYVHSFTITGEEGQTLEEYTLKLVTMGGDEDTWDGISLPLIEDKKINTNGYYGQMTVAITAYPFSDGVTLSETEYATLTVLLDED